MYDKKLLSLLARVGVLATCLCLSPGISRSQQPLSYRGIAVNLLKPDPEFMVRVDVDRDDRKYQTDEKVQVVVRSEEAGYLYLFYLDAKDQCLCIFPNASGADCHVQAKKDTHVPDLENPSFEFVITPPYGTEVLKAIVTERPVTSLPIERLQERAATEVPLVEFQKLEQELKSAAFRWGEVDLEITTVSRRSSESVVPGKVPPAGPPITIAPKKQTPPPSKPVAPDPHKRWGLFIGISRFANDGLALPASARNNAEMAAAAMQVQCGLTDRPTKLLDEQATLSAIQRAITKELSDRCDSGDDVFIYWSGRSGWLPDTNGDEGPDGRDEYLLPFDGNADNPGSLIIDDTFARWVQKLDRCNVTMILDTYSRDPHTDIGNDAEFDFLSTEVIRAKSLGETNIVLLSRSVDKRDEFSEERAVLSRMTGVYLEALQEEDGPFTLFDAYNRLKDEHIPTNLNDPDLARKIRLRN